ncbi:MAG: hypothetical protein K9J06_11655 [Flavobacteriales bacterium]|nr:hypothetical protein [Flavobacteriales bacterium]
MKTNLFQILGVVAIGVMSFSACETDACKDVNCGTNGTCVDGDCVCDTGYEGVSCQTEERTKFIGSYSVTEACTSGNYTYSLTVTTSATGVDKIVAQNFGDYGVDLVGTVDGSNVTFANQTVGGGTFSATGQLTGSILTISYTVTAGSSTDSCTITATKQ